MKSKVKNNVFIPCVLVVLCLLAQFSRAQNKSDNVSKRIVVEWILPANIKDKILNNSTPDKFELNYTATETFSAIPNFNKIEASVINGSIKWILYSDQPIIVNIDWMPGTRGVCSPGDSIVIFSKNDRYQYVGKGSEKFELFYNIHLALGTVKKSGSLKYAFNINSLDDYLSWNNYLDNCFKLIGPLIESYQSKIPAFELTYIKCTFFEGYEIDRVVAFTSLLENAESFGLNKNDVSAIADTTLFKPHAIWLHKNSNYFGNAYYFDLLDKVKLLKSLNFEQNKAILNNWILKYYRIKENYTGTLRERLLQLTVYKATNRSPLRTRQAAAILSDYYADASYPEYKEWVRVWQFDHWKKSLVSSHGSMNFALKDESGTTITKNDLKNKLVLFYFWKSNSSKCKEVVPALQKIYDRYKNDTNVVFLCISADTDRNQWFESIKERKYTIAGGTHFFVGADIANLSVIEYYNGLDFPGFILMNGAGVVVNHPLELPTRDNGATIINLIEKKLKELLSRQHDGPYVIHRGDSLDIYYIKSTNNFQLVKSSANSPLPITVQTDVFSSRFSTSIKKELKVEPCVYNEPSKQVVISDIEGNFDSFRKLLTASQVIDANFNWVFGDGHLVLVGDFFDRGKQVTECLWLAYSLEEKARKAGGYVHFILGNHEIMNMNNDTSYVDEKYRKTASLLNLTYGDLYSRNTELGRWLRTKNIIEKIGNILYVHGGISPSVNRMGLSVQTINDLARPYYDIKTDSTDHKLLTLFDSRKTRNEISRASPFWFRGYYENSAHAKEIPTMEQVDNTLSQFKVSRIITGHTIVKLGDKITSHYNDKIINVDTKHAEGKGKALFIIGDVFYQIDINGEKTLLFNKQSSTLANNNFIKPTYQNK